MWKIRLMAKWKIIIGKKIKPRHSHTIIFSSLMEEFIKPSVHTQKFWISYLYSRKVIHYSNFAPRKCIAIVHLLDWSPWFTRTTLSVLIIIIVIRYSTVTCCLDCYHCYYWFLIINTDIPFAVLCMYHILPFTLTITVTPTLTCNILGIL